MQYKENVMNLENLIAMAKDTQSVQESNQEAPAKEEFKDSDGKVIEENDIVLFYDTHAGLALFRIVSFDNEEGRFILKSPTKLGGYLDVMMANKGRYYIKVVGNTKNCQFPTVSE